MKSSSLALIHHTAENALQNMPTTRKVVRQVAGFDVEDVVPFTSTSEAKSFSADAEAIRAVLAEAGIVPLAVLPAAWWKQIVTRSKLLDFAPSPNGTVAVRTAQHTAVIKNGWSPQLAFFGLWMTLSLGLTGVLAATTSMQIGFIVPFAMLPSFIFTIFATLPKTLWAAVVSTAYVITRGGNKKLLPSILETDGFHSSRHVGVTLPKPPSNVMDVLLKADRAKLNMRVAAVPDAVSLAQSPRQLIASDLRKEWEEEAMRRREAARARAADPIIYVTRGSVVAIIAQFGDFPIEQRVVDEVVKSNAV